MRGPPTTYMILEADTLDGLLVAFDKIGLAAALERSRSLALKVNLARVLIPVSRAVTPA